MTSTLTRTAARIYGTLSGLGRGEMDVFECLLPFFDPILRPMQSHQFDVEAFAREVHDRYKWNFNSDVARVFLPHLIKAGWLTPDDPQEQITTYHVALPDTDADEELDNSAVQELRSLAEEFKKFSEKLSPLIDIPKDVEKFEDILIEWLLYVEAFSEADIEFLAKNIESPSETMHQVIDVPETTSLTSEEIFLCARFVAEAIRAKPEIGEKLARIASIGLLTEVVQDFIKPTTPVDNSNNLMVYLDAPVAMDYLGVSGKAARENTAPIVDELMRIGAKVGVFGQSIEEIKRNLKAVLTNPRPTGPTAQALARNEVRRDFVVEVSKEPDVFLSESRIKVTHRTLDQFPSGNKHFTEEDWKEIYSALNFQRNSDAQQHDADVTALIMRQRQGRGDRDIFRSRFVMITRNGLLAQLTKKRCIDLRRISSAITPPIIHRRFLTTAMWLRTGLRGQNFEVPKRLLLANCERVLEIKPGVVEAVRKVTKDLDDPDKSYQLDFLLSIPRSTQALMDKTLGMPDVVTLENFPEIFQEMLHPHLESERQRGAEAVEAERVKASELSESVRLLEDSQRHIINKLLEDTKKNLYKRKIIQWAYMILLPALVCVLPILEVYVFSILDLSNLNGFAFIIITYVLSFLTISGCKLIDVRITEQIAFKELNKLASQRHIDEILSQFDINWNEENFSFINNGISTQSKPD